MTAQPARSAQPDRRTGSERAATERAATELSPQFARVLEFEREWRRHSATKEDAIRRDLALSTVRYYQLLDAVIDSPAAVRYDPMLVGQLQRSRAARSAARERRTAVTDLHPHDLARPNTAGRPTEEKTD